MPSHYELDAALKQLQSSNQAAPLKNQNLQRTVAGVGSVLSGSSVPLDIQRQRENDAQMINATSNADRLAVAKASINALLARGKTKAEIENLTARTGTARAQTERVQGLTELDPAESEAQIDKNKAQEAKAIGELIIKRQENERSKILFGPKELQAQGLMDVYEGATTDLTSSDRNTRQEAKAILTGMSALVPQPGEDALTQYYSNEGSSPASIFRRRKRQQLLSSPDFKDNETARNDEMEYWDSTFTAAFLWEEMDLPGTEADPWLMMVRENLADSGVVKFPTTRHEKVLDTANSKILEAGFMQVFDGDMVRRLLAENKLDQVINDMIPVLTPGTDKVGFLGTNSREKQARRRTILRDRMKKTLMDKAKKNVTGRPLARPIFQRNYQFNPNKATGLQPLDVPTERGPLFGKPQALPEGF